MARRTDILNLLASDLAAVDGVETANVFRRWKFLEEINDFPSICFLVREEERQTIEGSDRRVGVMLIEIRGYVYNEDNLGAAEELGELIEAKVETFRRPGCPFGTQDARLVSLRTDEGLFEPYGIVDIQMIIVYELEI